MDIGRIFFNFFLDGEQYFQDRKDYGDIKRKDFYTSVESTGSIQEEFIKLFKKTMERLEKDTIDLIIEKDKEVASECSDYFGGFYDIEGVRRLLGLKGKPLSERAVLGRKDLLALKTGSGQIVYPRFQFIGRNPIYGIEKVVKELPDYLIGRWTLASWLVSPNIELDNERPIDVLAYGNLSAVIESARSWAFSLDPQSCR